MTALLQAKQDAKAKCEAYVGQTITPSSMSKVLSVVSKVPNVKAEFETTANFEARQRAALDLLPKQYIIGKSIDRKFVTYDADAGELRIQSYAFDNENIGYQSVFGPGRPFDGLMRAPGVLSTIDVVISDTEVPTAGSYIATNAFGVSVRVTRAVHTVEAIFEREGSFRENLFVDGPGIIGELALPPSEAKRKIKTLTGAFLVVPQAPFFASGATDGGEPTLDDPREVEQRTRVLVADIQCAFLLSERNEVLGAYATQ